MVSNLLIIFIGFIIGFIIGYYIKNFFKLSKSQQIERLKEWLIGAVAIAEKELGSGTGELKLRYVYNDFIKNWNFLAKILSFNEFKELVDQALYIFKTEILSKPKNIEYIYSGQEKESVNIC